MKIQLESDGTTDSGARLDQVIAAYQSGVINEADLDERLRELEPNCPAQILTYLIQCCNLVESAPRWVLLDTEESSDDN